MISDNRWSDWWFLNGGSIHGLWKNRQYSKIKELAMRLPKAAWDEQQKEITSLRKIAEAAEKYADNSVQTNAINRSREDLPDLGAALYETIEQWRGGGDD